MSKDNKSNYQKLQDNKKAALEFAAGITGVEIENREELLKESQTQIITDAKGAIDKGDFSTAIAKMDQLKDAKLGISWHESENLGNGTKALVRDARNVTDNVDELKNDAGEKYAMQALNEIRAAIDLLDTKAVDESIIDDQKDKTKENLKNLANHVLEQVENDPSSLNDKSIREINTYILDQLEKTGVDQPAEKLNFAKEVTNFKDEHKHIVTLTSAEDSKGTTKTVIEADIMLNGLSEEQKKMYDAIAKSKPRGTAVEVNGADMSWYNNMPDYKRQMIHDVANDIAKGNKVIPAQLIKDIPGLRNAYDKVTAVQHKPGEEPKIVAESLHCGTPATKIKPDGSKQEIKDRQEAIAQGNVDQLKTFVPDGQKVNLNNLASETPFNVRGEDFIQKQSEKAAKKDEQVIASASPINRWRRAGGAGREQKEFDNTLRNIGADLAKKEKNQTPKTAKYLQEGDSRLRRFASTVTFGLVKTNYQNAVNELNSLQTEQASVLKEAVSAKKSIKETTLFARADNVNLEISSKMAIVTTAITNDKGALHGIASPETKKQTAVTVSFCKSGKDRTGLVMMETSHQAVSQELGIDPNSEQGKANKLKMVAGGHTQEMAGIQGGTVGCHSIKTNPEFVLNDSSMGVDGIINQKSAKFNSSIKTVENKDKQRAVATIQTGVAQVQQKQPQQKNPVTPDLAQQAAKHSPPRVSPSSEAQRSNNIKIGSRGSGRGM